MICHTPKNVRCQWPWTLNLGIMFRKIAPKHNVFGFPDKTEPSTQPEKRSGLNEPRYEMIWYSVILCWLLSIFISMLYLVVFWECSYWGKEMRGGEGIRGEEEGEDKRSWMTCGASALELMLSAVQLSSFSLQLLLLPQQVGLSCSSSRLNQESHKHFVNKHSRCSGIYLHDITAETHQQFMLHIL